MRVLYDLTKPMSWGDKTNVLPHLYWLISKNREGENVLLTGNWSNMKKPSNIKRYIQKANEKIRTFNFKIAKKLIRNSFHNFKKIIKKIRNISIRIFSNEKAWSNKTKRTYLYNPSIEPVKFFRYLICPSFGFNAYFDVDSGIGDDNVIRTKYDKVYSGSSFDLISFRWTRDVSQFKYKIEKSQLTDEYYKVKKILERTTNIILCATWDDEMVYEHNRFKTPRLRGMNFSDEKFEQMKELVEKIDEYCLKNENCRIILYSKKAQGWTKILKSNFFDFREFEKDYNLNFAQSFHLIVDNSKASIAQTSSMQLWINCQKDMNHLTFVNYGKEPKYRKQIIKGGFDPDHEGSIIWHLKYFAIDGYDGEIKKIFEN